MASVQNKNKPKVALVHDWIYGGGAEKVVEQLHKIYPEAPIYTSYCTDEWRHRLDNVVVTGYLQHWPFSKLRKFLPLLRQWWFARLDLSGYDLIISTTGNGEAKFVQTPKGATHICYCHTPPHFYWRKYKDYLANPGFGKLNFLARAGLVVLVKPLRERDYRAAQKVDYFIGNSSHIVNDIKTFYGRDAVAIFPPIATSRFNKIEHSPAKELRFIAWARHVPDKKLDLAVQACNNLGLNLVIVGQGPETSRLKSLAGPATTFDSNITDAQLDQYIAESDALIFPSLEDFGIVPVEAMASGLPVIAYKAGGALDYVVEGKTGMFFDKQTVNSLEQVLKKFDPKKYDPKTIKKHAAKFSNEQFSRNFVSFVSSLPKAKK